METGEVLPYRTGAEELFGWVEARARGGAVRQQHDRAVAAKTLEGTAVAAEAFGWWRRDLDALTAAGEAVALGTRRERGEALRRAVLVYEPYARLLAAVGRDPEREVAEAQWIETWWATHGYGSSSSNRAEAVATLGRLAEDLELGRYVAGRRGHPTRIEWIGEALLADTPPAPAPRGPAAGEPPRRASPAEVREPRVAAAPPPLPAHTAAAEGAGGYNDVSVPLAGGRTARLVVPLRLPAAERRRLLSLLELLIAEEG